MATCAFASSVQSNETKGEEGLFCRVFSPTTGKKIASCTLCNCEALSRNTLAALQGTDSGTDGNNGG